MSLHDIEAISSKQIVWEAVELVSKLRDAPYNFFLTGSQFLGCAREDSDYDLVTEYTAEVERFLAQLGFTCIHGDEDSYIDDGYTPCIMEHAAGKLVLQVQLTTDINAKLFARNVVKSYFVERHRVANHEQKMQLWSNLMNAYNFDRDFHM